MTKSFFHVHWTLFWVSHASRRKPELQSSNYWFRFPSSASCFLPVLALIIAAVQASADTYQLICENPLREYTVSFSDGDINIQLGTPDGTTLYRVLAVEETTERHVVVALTVNDGPTARLSLRPYLRMEYWSGNELFQTDACRVP
ncbi:hypothetical protein [Antarctobacter heliothermus]|uniref:Uncharacterized protein n=1 Tax=Antarctobacter heliothermus TaxID=74033 RepID=A0A239HUT5_9RHOB|nr:hypothetical protein [Antarctobacter heliothermus]SNS83944.1 hypothetical protein SAMN04488078_103618 [Antarctobacter heliothermus]